MRRGFILYFKQQLYRWSIVTLFSGKKEDDIITLDLDKTINLDLPKKGKRVIYAFSLAEEEGNLFISGNIDPDGYFTYNLIDDILETSYI